MTESDKLALFSVTPDLTPERHKVPDVLTTATPEPGLLLAARAEVQRNDTLKTMFKDSRAEKWPSGILARAIQGQLSEKIEGTPEQIREVAVYITDEYEQVGDGVLLVSSTTGKALFRLTDADLWQPDEVPRDDGRMVKPAPRIRPDLHGMIVEWVFDREREARITQELALRLQQTELQRIEGDSRLLTVTKAGRAEVTDRLRDALPGVLEAVQGASRAFMRYFVVVEDAPRDSHWIALPKTRLVTRTKTPIVDPKTFNLKHDKLAALKAQMGVGWVREMAKILATEAMKHAAHRARVQYGKMSEAELVGARLWIGDPDKTRALEARVGSAVDTLAVPGVSLTGLQQFPVGAIRINPDSYQCESRELFDRWEVAAAVEVQLYVDWYKVVSLTLLDPPTPEVAAQLV